MTGRPGLELALTRATLWALAGAATAIPLLLIESPGPDRLLAVTIVHLTLLVTFGLVVVWDLTRYLDRDWFMWRSPVGSRLAAGVTVVALTVGVMALVTLPTSAALRFDPSLQFLQLLSALDIAWAAGATLIGVRWLRGSRSGVAAGVVVGVVCIWSIWNYLRIVGFAPGGGWQVDAGALLRYVLPYDAAAALVAITVLVKGARRVGLHAPSTVRST